MTESAELFVPWLQTQLDEQAASARFVLNENRAARAGGTSSTIWDERDADAQWLLADAEAKRKIVAHHAPANPGDPDGDRHCAGCGDMLPCPTLRFVGLAYAGLPGYREEWRP